MAGLFRLGDFHHFPIHSTSASLLCKMYPMKLRLTVLASAMFLFACGGNSQSAPTASSSAEGEKKQSVQTVKDVPLDEFVQLMAAKPNAIVLDVRTPEEVAEGRVACGEHIDFYDANFKARVKTLDHSAPVFVYCAVGGRSGQAMDFMKREGFTEVYNLQGGINAWRAAGKPTVNCD